MSFSGRQLPRYRDRRIGSNAQEPDEAKLRWVADRALGEAASRARSAPIGRQPISDCALASAALVAASPTAARVLRMRSLLFGSQSKSQDLSITVRSLPPNHRSVGCSAHEHPAIDDAAWGLHWSGADAARIDRHVIMERYLVEIAVNRTEIGEVRTAPCKGIKAFASRRRDGQVDQCNEKNSKSGSDLSSARHFVIPLSNDPWYVAI